MKIKTLVLAVVALAMGLGSARLMAEEGKEQPKSPFTKDSCCAKAYAENKACSHQCCLDAAKENKVCVKCNKEAKADAVAFDAGGCCAKAYVAGGACNHPCCVKAAKASGLCAKCNPKKAEKKEEAKA